jgi:hypothetical protein
VARHFLKKYCVKLGRSWEDIDQESLERLIRYTWPGNVRELQNVIERAMIPSHDPLLRIDDHVLGRQDSSVTGLPLTSLKDVEERHILQTLALTNWHIEGADGAAGRLGIPPSTLRSRMKQLGLKRPPASCRNRVSFPHELSPLSQKQSPTARRELSPRRAALHRGISAILFKRSGCDINKPNDYNLLQ